MAQRVAEAGQRQQGEARPQQDRHAQLGAAARAHVRAERTWAANGERYLELYLKVNRFLSHERHSGGCMKRYKTLYVCVICYRLLYKADLADL